MVSFEDFEKQWLEDILANNPTSTQKGQLFAAKILRDWNEIDSETSEIIFCDGMGDGGIDAAIFIKEDQEEGIEGDTWILIQSKYGKSYTGIDTILSESQKLFATLEGKRDNLSSLSSEVISRIRNFIDNCGPKDRLDYIVATNRRITEEEQEYLNNVKTLGRSKFGEIFDVDSISIETIYNKSCEDSIDESTVKLELKTTITHSGETLLIGATKLRDIFVFMNEYKKLTGDLDFLYERNVRKFLGNKRKVNKGIEKTIENNPERFGLYNNGITFVAESASAPIDGKITITNPFIVNGCQTTKSIWSVLQRRLNSGGHSPTAEQARWESALDTAVVVTKIVIVGSQDNDLLTETTRYTNSQNAVSDKDFIALEKDFRNWMPEFNKKFGVFLEIQRGAWEARRAFQKQNPLSTPIFTEYANAFDLLKTYAAGWLHNPGIAFGKNPPFAPNGSLFKQIVNDENFNIDSLFAAYRLYELASQYHFGRGGNQTRTQTRFLFIMVIVDIIRYFLTNSHLPSDNQSLTQAIIKLHHKNLLHKFGKYAILLIDAYLTDGNEDSLFNEDEYLKHRNLNVFLKSEKLGQKEDYSPILYSQIKMHQKMFIMNENKQEIIDTLNIDLSQIYS